MKQWSIECRASDGRLVIIVATQLRRRHGTVLAAGRPIETWGQIDYMTMEGQHVSPIGSEEREFELVQSGEKLVAI